MQHGKLTPQQQEVHQAEYDKAVDEELAERLAWKHAVRSAKSGDAGAICLRYTEISHELRTCPMIKEAPPLEKGEREAILTRCLSSSETESATTALMLIERTMPEYSSKGLYSRITRQFLTKRSRGRFFKRMERVIRAYEWARRHDKPFATNYKGPNGNLKLRVFGSELLPPLVEEWLRDPMALKKYLTALFHLWKRIDAPDSSWRLGLVINQIAPVYGHDAVAILTRLQQIGAAPMEMTTPQQDAWLARIRQRLSRAGKQKK